MLLLLGVSPSVAQEKGKNTKKDKADAAQQAEISALMAAIDALMAGNAGDNTLPLKWEQHHFIKALGSKTYVPFTLTIDPPAFTASTTVGIYIRVAKHGEPAPAPAPPADPKKDKTAASASPPPQYPFDYGFFMDVAPAAPGQPQRIRRAFDVEPGEYRRLHRRARESQGRLDAGGVAQDRHPEAVRHGAGLRRERADDEQRHRRGESGRAQRRRCRTTTRRRTRTRSGRSS